MLIRSAVVTMAFLSAGSISAQENGVVSVMEWRQGLEDVAVNDSVALTKRATEYSKEAAALLRTGNRSQSLKRTVMAIVLTKHVHDLIRAEGRSVPMASLSSINELQSAIINAGVAASVFQKSASNLKSMVISSPKLTDRLSKTTKRAATVAERASMIAVIKANLYDPTTAIFGRSDISGNLACFTINARNRSGALTGNQEAVLYFEQATKSWLGGETADVSHDVCLSMADNVGE